MIESDEIKLPAEFQVSLYEDLIQQLQKKGGFNQVYREGDRNAENAADLVICTARCVGFKEGSERVRQVTTVAGATSITVHCVFTTRTENRCWRGTSKGMCDSLAGTCVPRMTSPRRRRRWRTKLFA